MALTKERTNVSVSTGGYDGERKTLPTALDYQAFGCALIARIERMCFEDWVALVTFQPATPAEVVGRRMILEGFAAYHAAARAGHIELFVRNPTTPSGDLRPRGERLHLLCGGVATMEAS